MTHRRARARRATWPAFALLALLFTIPVHAQQAPSDSSGSAPAVSSDGPPIPDAVGYVNDVAGIMDEPSRAKLEAFLDQVHQKTGAQFAVLTMKNTAPVAPSEYKVKVFEKWGIGDKDRDDGLLMLVALDEREVRFETGYGLEGVLPDGLQSRIVRDEMAPHFREGDYTAGIIAGVLASSARIAKDKGVTLEWDGRELRYSGGGEIEPPLWMILLLGVVVIMVISAIGSAARGNRRRGRSGWDDWGNWGGFGGWGGGFGGGGFGRGGFGGGGFGGGGGGGGSFGGFGGGGSGGGGGGGKW